MLRHREAAHAAGAVMLFVVADEKELVERMMMKNIDVGGVPVLVDLPRKFYRSWGLGRTSPLGLYFSPRATARLIALLRNGERLRGFGRDTLQLGGDFVIDPEGRITFAHPMSGPLDRAPVRRLIDCLLAASGVAAPLPVSDPSEWTKR